jgi:hypothetical protein
MLHPTLSRLLELHTRLKGNIVRDKHTSLFCCTVSDAEILLRQRHTWNVMTPSSKSADETLMVRRTVCVTVAVVTVMFIKLLRIAAPRGVIWRQRHETFFCVNDAVRWFYATGQNAAGFF